MIGKIIVLVFLLWGSIWDIRKKSIPNLYVWFGVIVGVINLIFKLIGGNSIWEVVLACLPGILFIILSFVTGEQIGMGDGLVIFCTGFFMNHEEIIFSVFLSFLFLTIVSVVFFSIGRVTRKTKVPFLPFWLMGVISCIIGGST